MTTFNNLLVESLKLGEASALQCMISLGQNPLVDIDYVVEITDNLSFSKTDVQKKSIWYWIHQSANDDAVSLAWKYWIPKFVASFQSYEQNEVIKNLIENSLGAAIESNHIQPFLYSWEKYLNWTNELQTCPKEMLKNILESSIMKYGDSCLVMLNSLNAQGFFNGRDAIRLLSNSNIINNLVQSQSPNLFQVLLDISGTVSPQKGVDFISKIDSSLHALLNSIPDPSYVVEESKLQTFISMYLSLKPFLKNGKWPDIESKNSLLDKVESINNANMKNQLKEIFIERSIQIITSKNNMVKNRF